MFLYVYVYILCMCDIFKRALFNWLKLGSCKFLLWEIFQFLAISLLKSLYYSLVLCILSKVFMPVGSHSCAKLYPSGSDNWMKCTITPQMMKTVTLWPSGLIPQPTERAMCDFWPNCINAGN